MKKHIFTLIVFALSCCSSLHIYAQAGSLDSTFGVNGISLSLQSYDCQLIDIAVQPDKKIIATGTLEAFEAIVVRYKSNGTIDSSFGDNGFAKTNSILDSSYVYYSADAAALQADGKIVVVINCDGFNAVNYFLVRYNSNGTPDSSFGINGVVAEYSLDITAANDLVIQPDGKIITAGDNFGTSSAMVRYNKNGSKDASFGNGGIVKVEAGKFTATIFEALALNSKNKIIVTGRATFKYYKENTFILSYNTDGTPDSSFGENGTVIAGVKSRAEEPSALQILPDDKIIVSATVYGDEEPFSSGAVIKFNANGTVDNSFGDNGKVFIKKYRLQLNDVAVQPDGKIIAAGSYTAGDNHLGMVLFRMLSNGVLDDSFGDNGVSLTHGFVTIGRIAWQRNDKLIVAGNRNYLTKPETDFCIARFNTEAGALIADNKESITSKNIHSIIAFPNPAKNIITISGISALAAVKINIIDNNGRVVKTETIQNIRTKNFDISALTPGIYYIQITDGIHTNTINFLKQ